LIVRTDRGSASVEVAILTPAFLLLIVVAAVVGRVAIAQNAIDLAAHDAARAASISRTAAAAHTAATAAAGDTLAQQGLLCDPLDVDVDVTDFATDPGQPADPGNPPVVTVDVSCVVSLVDLPMLDVDDVTVAATHTSPLDFYRGRT
jgi:Flp pilus assembly protein TadG